MQESKVYNLSKITDTENTDDQQHRDSDLFAPGPHVPSSRLIVNVSLVDSIYHGGGELTARGVERLATRRDGDLQRRERECVHYEGKNGVI